MTCLRIAAAVLVMAFLASVLALILTSAEGDPVPPLLTGTLAASSAGLIGVLLAAHHDDR